MELERERELLIGQLTVSGTHGIGFFIYYENAMIFIFKKMKTRYKKTTKHCHLWWISQKLKKNKKNLKTPHFFSNQTPFNIFTK